MAALRKLPPIDRIALILSLIMVLVSFLIADRIYERMSHLEDEMAYVWEAQVIAGGDLVLPSPPLPKSFLTPFVVDYHGVRFSKYPPGWPVVLAIGVLTGLRDWVNPLLSGFSVWLLYLFAKRITSPKAGLLAMILMILSPMFLMLSGTFLSHIWSLVLTLGLALAWLDTFEINRERRGEIVENDFGTKYPPKWLTVSVAGLSLGVLVLTRPMTAFGVGLPFIVHGILLLVRGNKTTRMRVIAIGLLAGVVGLLFFAWQFAVTGDALLNPYTLWWKYDKVGFGPGIGRWKDGYTPNLAWYNIKYSFNKSQGDLLGWEQLWWIFLPFGMWSLRRMVGGWLAAGIFPGLMLAYALYWIGSWLYGPRYYFEGLISLTVLNAAGIAWLAGDTWRIRKAIAGLALALLVGYTLFAYLPGRLEKMHGLYNIERKMLEPFSTPEALDLTPALVVVHPQKGWTDYGGLLELQNAQLTTSFIFVVDRNGIEITDYQRAFPDRHIYYYYPDEPGALFPKPR